MVEPLGLLHVELGAALAATLQREGLDELVHGEDTLADQRQADH